MDRGGVGVLVDLDDTLFDHTLTVRRAIGRTRHLVPEFAGVPLDRLARRYGELLNATHSRVLHGELTTAEARAVRWRRLVEEHGGRASARRAKVLATAYRRAYDALRRPVPGAATLVRRLAAVAPVAVVTNNNAYEPERKLRFLGIRDDVHTLVASAAVGVHKPDPRIFDLALARLGARADRSVMIGDSWEWDVLGALGAGVRPIWFNRFARPRPPGPDVAEVDDLRPARRIVELVRSPRARAPATRVITRRPVRGR